MIPEQAVEAAMRAWGVTGEDQRKIVGTILEAAAPYIRETVTEWAAAFRLTGEPYNFHRTREEAQAFVDDMSKQDVDMVVMTREVLPAQASEWAPYILNNEGKK